MSTRTDASVKKELDELRGELHKQAINQAQQATEQAQKATEEAQQAHDQAKIAQNLAQKQADLDKAMN